MNKKLHVYVLIEFKEGTDHIHGVFPSREAAVKHSVRAGLKPADVGVLKKSVVGSQTFDKLVVNKRELKLDVPFYTVQS